ncbi:MAG: C45 family peptidase [Planctomycetia bacterium]|nr:C45 family peptidase [Planctomycetia bacterium]
MTTSSSRRVAYAFTLAICLGAVLTLALPTFAQNADHATNDEAELVLVNKVPHGLLVKAGGVRDVLILQGDPQEIGNAYGLLMKDAVNQMYQRLLAVGFAASFMKKINFTAQIDESIERSEQYMPERFYQEIDAMADAVGRTRQEIRRLNSFPELFHCSGVAVKGNASVNGKIIHARVLDYMRDIGLQENSVLILTQPNGYNAWLSVSYAGFVGSVTAMNQKGLAIGEIGGGGAGKWDGLPMAFLIRRIMEECDNVDQAIALMKSVPLTCDYFYVLSDATGRLVAVAASAQTDNPVVVLEQGQEHELLPGALPDVVYVSAGERAQALYERLKEYYGKIDVNAMMEIIKRPVAMKSNLHDAIMTPETLDLWHAEAGLTTLGCDEPYLHVNIKTLMEFYNAQQDQ